MLLIAWGVELDPVPDNDHPDWVDVDDEPCEHEEQALRTAERAADALERFYERHPELR